MTTIDASAHPDGTHGGDGREGADPADPAATVQFALADLDAAHGHADGATDPDACRAS
jgi:hypothetical protein